MLIYLKINNLYKLTTATFVIYYSTRTATRAEKNIYIFFNAHSCCDYVNNFMVGRGCHAGKEFVKITINLRQEENCNLNLSYIQYLRLRRS